MIPVKGRPFQGLLPWLFEKGSHRLTMSNRGVGFRGAAPLQGAGSFIWETLMWRNNGHPAKGNNRESEVFDEREREAPELHK